MAIDISQETPLSLTQAAKLPHLPIRRAGKRPCVATFWRWSTTGIRGVRLETLICGGVRCTSQQAIQRFFDHLTNPQAPPPPIVTSRAQRAAVRAAERVLDKAGI
jgi:hypothetical protein